MENKKEAFFEKFHKKRKTVILFWRSFLVGKEMLG